MKRAFIAFILFFFFVPDLFGQGFSLQDNNYQVSSVTNTYYNDSFVNLYTTNLFVTNITYGYGELESNVSYKINTNTLSGTNLVVDMKWAVQTIDAPGTFQLLSTTNRPSSTRAMMCLLVINNFQATNIEVVLNTNVGWKIDGSTFPISVATNTVQTLTFIARGDNETNVLVGTKWFALP